MNDFNAFVDALRQDRTNETLHLIFADWLEDHGDPRADLIRWQIARTHLTADDPAWLDLYHREQDWLSAHTELLLGNLPTLVCDWQLERGWVVEVTVEASVFLEQAEALCQAVPLAKFRVVTDRQPNQEGDDLLRRLAVLPALTHVHALELTRSAVAAEGVSELVASHYIGELLGLELNHNLLGDVGLQTMVRSPYLTRLEHLALRHNLIGDGGVEALATAPHLKRLTLLDLEGNCLSDIGLTALAAGPLVAQLTTLNLSENMLSDRGVHALVQLAGLERLTGLDLSGNHITNQGAAALARCPGLRKLKGLDLGGNHLTDMGRRALQESPYLGHLFHDHYAAYRS